MSLSKISEWNKESAIHLLSRTLFGFSKEDIDFALSYSIEDYVDNYLLRDLGEPQSPGFWVDDNSSYNNSVRSRELIYWWFNLMLNESHSVRERMVLFWHNHFVSELSTVKLPQRMYHQNKLFRNYAFGNFKELTKKVTIDPAMLIYLDNTKNRKEDPNENYARELLELFTLGIGNYTEEDIVEAARALTGWQVEGLESFFNEERFDNGSKTFLGQTGNFNYEDIIEIIFAKPEASMHICSKLYKEFIYFEPDETVVTEMANILKENNFEIKPVLSAMLKSEYFHLMEVAGAKIKGPVEYIIALHKHLKIEKPNYEVMRILANDIGQTLFSPPNVAGWEGDKTWINTNTLPARNVFSDKLVNSDTMEFDLLKFARSFESSEDALLFIDEITDSFFSYDLSENRKAYLLELLLDGAALYDWSTYNENSEARLGSFFRSLFRLSEYQLT